LFVENRSVSGCKKKAGCADRRDPHGNPLLSAMVAREPDEIATHNS
jgi:hypothetical protein